MFGTTTARILADQLFERGLRESYWATRARLSRLARLLKPANSAFTLHAAKDQAAFLTQTVRSIEGENRERMQASAAWLLRAQDATRDRGVSLGYFPCDPEPGWRASYPETTGYIISTLLDYAGRYGDTHARDRALLMADWEIDVQMPSGAVQGGPVCPPGQQTPVAFNTGMVLDGWSAAYRTSRELAYLEAGRRAADFLVSDLDDDGYFRTHGRFVTEARIKTYSCLCAWPMYRFGEDAGDERYLSAATRVVEAALRQQKPNGWFANNCLGRGNAPLLHTIGYTLQGILEVGILSGRHDLVEAARLGTDPIVRDSRSGFLPGRFYSDWVPASFSSCLTGSAQLAVVCYRLAKHLDEPDYRGYGDRILNFLKGLQVLDSADPSINGALAGSFPLFGSYMMAGYPNWATKFFLDGLMLQVRAREN